jgi:hypothetical protein
MNRDQTFRNRAAVVDRVRIVRCQRCRRVYSVVPPQSEVDAQLDHDAEYHAVLESADGH